MAAPEIFYHASHEQFAPSELLQLAILAEKAGFDGVHSSDHFHPWSEQQGQSGFSFTWIAAAMQATTIPFSMVCAPGQRYHPAIIAQAIATLCELFPARINFELGSGEALNEVITGEDWPSKKIRNERLLECVMIIRRLLTGEKVNYTGHVRVKNARLYTLPEVQPLLLCAAISDQTAAWAANWADGLLTTAEQQSENNIKKIKAFYDNGGRGKPVYLQYAFSYAREKAVAEEEAFQQWRSNVIPKEKLASLQTVEDFDKAAAAITKEKLLQAVPVFTDMQELFVKIDELSKTGAARVILHNVNRQQRNFIEDYGNYRIKQP
jgi:coenzyme F420-dependent glucose-6-phosphate dehydrogenase